MMGFMDGSKGPLGLQGFAELRLSALFPILGAPYYNSLFLKPLYYGVLVCSCLK